jgi:hypothetical protein
VQDVHILAGDSVEDYEAADPEAAQTRTWLQVIALASHVRMRREQKETFRDPVNKPVRDFDAAALGRCVVPNFVEFDFGLWGETVRHQVFGA